jgi:hypothetical protein
MESNTMTLEISRLAVEIFIAQAPPPRGWDDARAAAAVVVAPRALRFRALRGVLEAMEQFYVL